MKLEEGSKYLILKTLEKFNGNKTRAAEALGITTRTIRNKLAEYQTEEKADLARQGGWSAKDPRAYRAIFFPTSCRY